MELENMFIDFKGGVLRKRTNFPFSADVTILSSKYTYIHIHNIMMIILSMQYTLHKNHISCYFHYFYASMSLLYHIFAALRIQA